jgi:hypothetical protein
MPLDLLVVCAVTVAGPLGGKGGSNSAGTLQAVTAAAGAAAAAACMCMNASMLPDLAGCLLTAAGTSPQSEACSATTG